MRDRAVRTLREVGWTVEVSDLHAMGFLIIRDTRPWLC
jgi:hypothetical protein